MRKKTKELIAVKRMESMAPSTQATESVESTQYASARAERQKRMKEIRKYAKLRGLPAGFYRPPNAEEKLLLETAKAEQKKTNEQKILENEQRIKDEKRIKKDLKEVSFEDMMFLAKFDSTESE